MKKIKLLLNAIIGNLYKLKIWFHLWFNIKPQRSNQIAQNVIVSLTSYGRRISKCAPYTVFSMIVQTMRPEKITLWLDKEKWNDMNLPFALKRMQEWDMVDVEYCKDVRSYTKLIPALKKYPDKVIITVDDDIYYSSNLVHYLFEAYTNSSNSSVIAARYVTYSYEKGEQYTLPLGTGGVLYPPNSLCEKVFNEILYLRMCSSLDDLWFYIMTLLAQTDIEFLQHSVVKYFYTDLFYQKFHKGSRLYEVVRLNNKKKLEELLVYFKVGRF